MTKEELQKNGCIKERTFCEWFVDEWECYGKHKVAKSVRCKFCLRYVSLPLDWKA